MATCNVVVKISGLTFGFPEIMRGSESIQRSSDLNVTALETIPDGAGSDETQALTKDAAIGHVLLVLEIGKSHGTGEHQNVRQIHKSLEEGEGGFERKSFAGVNHVDLPVGGSR